MENKFILKQRSISPAKRNPFRPSQRTKRGPWRTTATYSNPRDAMVEYRRLITRGMSDRGVFYKGERITTEYHMISNGWQEELGVNSVGEPKPVNSDTGDNNQNKDSKASSPKS